MRQLRQGPRRPRFPDRGAEDRQEGAEGAEPGREEEINAVDGERGGTERFLWFKGWEFRHGSSLLPVFTMEKGCMMHTAIGRCCY